MQYLLRLPVIASGKPDAVGLVLSPLPCNRDLAAEGEMVVSYRHQVNTLLVYTVDPNAHEEGLVKVLTYINFTIRASHGAS
jgi:hypothetical protein